MKTLTSALALMATLTAPAYAGGLATSPRPPERPEEIARGERLHTSYPKDYKPAVLGCDWPVYGRDGTTILYWTGTVCEPIPEDGPTASPRPVAPTSPDDGPAFTPPVAGPPGPVDPVHPVEPVHPERPKGNASANNGRGGNYDHTGHTDNGKGRGKGRD